MRRAFRGCERLSRSLALTGLGVLATAGSAASQGSGDPPPGSRADYRIEARLDGETSEPKTLSGALELAVE